MYMRRLARGSKGRVGRRGGEEWRREQVRTKDNGHRYMKRPR